MIPYSEAKRLITMAVIGVEENDDNKALIYCIRLFSVNRKLRLRTLRHGSSERLPTSKIGRAKGVPSPTFARSAKSTAEEEGRTEILGMPC
ncbi:hypothetical protein ALC57_01427 [Trachymyrmex cornetzi]|uniref:Uncharacterized protein n=1 Tax=Trachymyrmex cornetzi TaxID=471704 RepID=A0A151JQJ1_9HYME|nr:hypothetical protein ALC57_01427 [Trachymyrmex cornetzi]